MEIESAIAKSLQRLGYTELNVDYSVKRAMKGKGKNVWCSLVAIRIAGKVGKEAGNVSREIAEFMELNREEIGLDQDVERIVGEENGFINFYLRQVDESKDVEVEAEIEQNLSSFALDENLDFGFSENFKCLAIVQSCFPEKFGTPRQASLAPSTRGRVVFRPDIDAECIEGIEEFSHIWLVFVFDKNDGSRGKGWTFKSKIKAPKLEGKKTGIFASRSPHRFNPIGLSVVRLESVETNVQIGMQKHVVLNISGLDLVHNTTILDVKPYHPADKIQNSKSPDWLAIHNQENFLNVEFTKEAINSIQNAIDSKSLKFYSDFNSIQQAIIECLQIDPRTTHSKSKSHELYGIAIDRLDISFRHVFSTNSILVFHIALIQAGQIRPRMRSQSWLKTHSHKNS